MKHKLAVLVENNPGVLAKVSNLFSRRGYNIESLVVSDTEDKTISRMTIVVEGDEKIIEQVTKQLHKLVKGLMCHINLIPLNEVEESPLKPAKPNEVEAFIKTLETLGVSATIRREMGSDIQGACGQLRRKYLGEDKR